MRVRINGVDYEFDRPMTILEAARSKGVYIPTLCYEDRLKPYGSCRLCVVEVKGRGLVTACTTYISDGMEILTESENVVKARKTILGLAAEKYPINYFKEYPNKEFHQLLTKYGIEPSGSLGRLELVDDSHPYIHVDMNKCMQCFRCVRACEEVQGYFVWRIWNRSNRLMIRPDGLDLAHSPCVSCGLCVDVCPTGALEDRSIILYGEPERWVETTCPYCGVGCQVRVGVKDGRIVTVRPSIKSEVNAGLLCVKGRYAYEYLYSQDRITHPMVKVNGEWRVVTWDEAINYVANRLREIINKYGPDSVAIRVGTRITNEEEYLAQKLARVVIGTNNVDNSARLCHEPSAQGLEEMFGTGAATNTFDDIENARTIMIVGSNTTHNHPVVGARIKRQVLYGGAKLIVIDPRRIELSKYATINLQLRPGTDVALLNAMANVIVTEGLYDGEFIAKRVDGFEEFRRHISKYTPEYAQEVTGVDAELIREAARLYTTNKPSMTFWSLGITEHFQGTEAVYSLINLALITGNVGRPGAGLVPLRGQNNVQAGTIMGAHPKKLVGGVPITSPEHRKKFEDVWGCKLPEKPGLDGIEIIDAAERGGLKALIIFGEDTLASYPNKNRVEKALSNLELVVQVDMYLNETSKVAHVFLPAASAYEKDGTFTNGDRHIQRVRKVVDPPGEARPDWEIIVTLAKALRLNDKFNYKSPEDVWNEIRNLWPSVYGITYEKLDKVGGIPYPAPTLDSSGTKILHVGKFTIGERARLKLVDYVPSPEQPSPDYPFMLITGRVIYQYNMGTMTRRTPNMALHNTDYIEINSVDARKLGINDGDEVRIISKYGQTEAKAVINDDVPPGVVFATIHHPSVLINRVVGNVVDRIVHTPEYKLTAVKIEKAQHY
jgi:formate dehydrogenase major subunit